MTLLPYFYTSFIVMLPHISSTVMIVIGVTWAKRNRKNCRSTTKPVILAVFGPILCIILTILAIYFYTMNWEDSFGPVLVFVVIIALGSLQFLIYGLPLLHLIFGLVWLRLLKNRKEPRRKRFIIWIIVQVVLMFISVLVLISSGPITPNMPFVTG